MENQERYKKGSIFRHFKGGIYVCEGLYKHSENGQMYVAYRNKKTEEGFIRPYFMFTSRVDKQKYPNVKQEYRFEYIGEEV